MTPKVSAGVPEIKNYYKSIIHLAHFKIIILLLLLHVLLLLLLLRWSERQQQYALHVPET